MSRWDDFISGFNSISTVNLRIVFTLIAMWATTADYILHNHDVDAQWLIFLGAMAGVDVVQYGVKRKTSFATSTTPPSPTQDSSEETEEDVTTTTDIQELREDQKG